MDQRRVAGGEGVGGRRGRRPECASVSKTLTSPQTVGMFLHAVAKNPQKQRVRDLLSRFCISRTIYFPTCSDRLYLFVRFVERSDEQYPILRVTSKRKNRKKKKTFGKDFFRLWVRVQNGQRM